MIRGHILMPERKQAGGIPHHALIDRDDSE
jgi:hypothetical protein